MSIQSKRCTEMTRCQAPKRNGVNGRRYVTGGGNESVACILGTDELDLDRNYISWGWRSLLKAAATEYDQHLSARLLDFFSDIISWQRTLWTPSTILILHELLDRSVQVANGLASQQEIEILRTQSTSSLARASGLEIMRGANS